jgi:hypothetical protein
MRRNEEEEKRYWRFIVLLLGMIFLAQLVPHIDVIKNMVKAPAKNLLINIFNKNEILNTCKEIEDSVVFVFSDVKDAQDLNKRMKDVELKFLEALKKRNQ